MNIGIYYYGLSFFLLCDEMWKREPEALCLSLHRFSSQRDTLAINLSLRHKFGSNCHRIIHSSVSFRSAGLSLPIISGSCNALINLFTYICPSVVTLDI